MNVVFRTRFLPGSQWSHISIKKHPETLMPFYSLNLSKSFYFTTINTFIHCLWKHKFPKDWQPFFIVLQSITYYCVAELVLVIQIASGKNIYWTLHLPLGLLKNFFFGSKLIIKLQFLNMHYKIFKLQLIVISFIQENNLIDWFHVILLSDYVFTVS